MKKLRLIFTSLLALTTAACNAMGNEVQCTADSAQAPVVDIVKEQLEKLISSKVRSEDGARQVSLSKIRAAIGQLVIQIEDIRTSKEDPNSTKRFCSGTLKLRFPTDTLSDADRAREAAGLNDVTTLADNSDIERQADSFTTAVEFNVQPTDDGEGFRRDGKRQQYVRLRGRGAIVCTVARIGGGCTAPAKSGRGAAVSGAGGGLDRATPGEPRIRQDRQPARRADDRCDLAITGRGHASAPPAAAACVDCQEECGL